MILLEYSTQFQFMNLHPNAIGHDCYQCKMKMQAINSLQIPFPNEQLGTSYQISTLFRRKAG